MHKPLSPKTVACLLILMLARYGLEKGKTVQRARFSRRTMLKVSTRKTLREAFIRDVRDELADIGWALMETSDGYAIANVDVLEGWTLISSKRVNNEIAQAKSGALDENDVLGLLDDDDVQESDEGE